MEPWDIPTTVEASQSVSTLQLTPTNASNPKGENTRYVDIVEESATINNTRGIRSNESLPQFSPSRSKTGTQVEEISLCEEGSGNEFEALEAETKRGIANELENLEAETDAEFVTDGEILDEEWDEEKEKEDQIQYNLAEFTEPGQRLIVAQGGNGGLGNVCYPKAFKNPKHGKKEVQKNKGVDDEVSDEEEDASLSVGVPGSLAVLLLELKSIADVGLVGMPNAGKSTLLGALSRARPIVGHYAFTTLRPNLGKVNYDDLSVTVADIPGLIRGAHENRGLGHAFLRHIERTKVIAYIVDLAAALDGKKGIHPWEQLKDLVLELEFYREGLSKRPSLIVANKIDEEGADQVYEELKRRVTGVPIFPVCAVLDEGVAELKDGLRMLVSGKESHRLDLDKIELD